jgi:NAD(P)H-flavin reductase
MFLRDRYNEIADNYYEATDDGSCGEKGWITGLAEKVIEKNSFSHVFTCGPTPMMRTLADMVKNSGIEIEVSVENYFGCGVGLCSGCTVETVHGNRRACVDGPVFNGKEINWDALQGSHYDEACRA